MTRTATMYLDKLYMSLELTIHTSRRTTSTSAHLPICPVARERVCPRVPPQAYKVNLLVFDCWKTQVLTDIFISILPSGL